MLPEKKILNETKNHNPPPPFKLNGRSLTGHLKKQLDSNISENVDTVTNFDETTEEKKEDLDDSLSNSSLGK